MRIPSYVPSGPEFLREAIIVIGGAIIAAIVISRIPALKQFIQANTSGSCDCDKP